MRWGDMVQLLDSDVEQELQPLSVEVVMAPPLHAGLSAALRQAYAVPLEEMAVELQRLLAKLH